MSYIRIQKWSDALADANTAVKIDPMYAKGWHQLLRCHLAFGDIQPAHLAEKTLHQLEPSANYKEFTDLDDLIRANDNVNKSILKEDYRSIIFYSKAALKVATENVSYQVFKAEALAHMHRYEESNDAIVPLLRLHPTNPDVHYARGVLLYYQELFDRAIMHFQSALRFNQDHEKARTALKITKFLVQTKEAGNQAYRVKNYVEALEKYLHCLKVDPNHNSFNSKLNFNLALVSSAQGNNKTALDYCLAAIKLDPNYVKAQLKLAQLYLDMEMYEEAVRELEAVYQKNRTREIRSLLEEAKTRLKRSKRKDWYKILGVDKNASEDQIKRAFKKAAVIHHPDKHQNDPPEEQKEHEMRMKDLNSAQAILLDQEKRRRFDLGIDDSEASSSVDPRDIFNTFYRQRGGHFSPFQHFVFE